MTFVFFFILILNCLVIFGADALLGSPGAANITTTTIVLNGDTSSLPLSLQNLTQQAIKQPEDLYAAESASGQSNGSSERKNKVFGRKGVTQEFAPSNGGEPSAATIGESRIAFSGIIVYVHVCNIFAFICSAVAVERK